MTKFVVLNAAILVLLTSISGFCDDQYVPTENGELFATWTNQDLQTQKTINFFGGYKDYNQIGDIEPTGGEGTEQIMSKVTDSAGDIWGR